MWFVDAERAISGVNGNPHTDTNAHTHCMYPKLSEEKKIWMCLKEIARDFINSENHRNHLPLSIPQWHKLNSILHIPKQKFKWNILTNGEIKEKQEEEEEDEERCLTWEQACFCGALLVVAFMK